MKTLKRVDPVKSRAEWIGKKVTGRHYGNINIKDGVLEFDNTDLTGGEILINMESIDTKDLTGSNKEKLEGYLHSDQFFGTNKHKTSTLRITDSSKEGNLYHTKGDLEIKGRKKPVEFNLRLNGDSASAQVEIDRTEYGIRFGSKRFFKNIGDSAIHDKFFVNVNLKF